MKTLILTTKSVLSKETYDSEVQRIKKALDENGFLIVDGTYETIIDDFDMVTVASYVDNSKGGIGMLYVDQVYENVKNDCKGMDAIYQDYIIKLVGAYGLQVLIEHKLLESCGVIDGRQLYVLCEKKES